MKENVYCIYDTASKLAIKPFMVERNDVVPIRTLQQLVNEKTTIFHKHAMEFELIHIAELDTETLEVKPVEMQRVVTTASELKRPDA